MGLVPDLGHALHVRDRRGNSKITTPYATAVRLKLGPWHWLNCAAVCEKLSVRDTTAPNSWTLITLVWLAELTSGHASSLVHGISPRAP